MTRPTSAGTHTLTVGLYTLTIFLSAALLFLVQPLFARMVLPLLGGSPAVWNTALVFYQVVLLAGYSYAYATTRWLGARQQAALHVAILLLPLLVLPIGLPEDWLPSATHAPAVSLLVLLAMTVGLPFFVVSSTSPLLQRWFADSGHSRAADPYFLYGASNLGSLLALVAYPLVVERLLPLGDQGRWWTYGYVLLAALGIACVASIWRGASPSNIARAHVAAAEPAAAPTGRERLLWLALAAVPVSLMLSVTMYISTDISALPLLWVIPLALYLLTFVLSFARRTFVPHAVVAALVPFPLAALTVLIAAKEETPNVWIVSVHLLSFFVIALACHGRLASLRPSPIHLPEFYWWVSLGGAIGGLLNSLVAPLVFERVVEYPVTLVIAAAIVLSGRPSLDSKKAHRRFASPLVLDVVLPLAVCATAAALVLALQDVDQPTNWQTRALMFGLPAVACLALVRRPIRFALGLSAIFAAGTLYVAGRGTLIYEDRTFFGINRVVRVPSGNFHVLGHGNTTHGAQSRDSAGRREPLTYFHRAGPLGQIFSMFNEKYPLGRVAVVGLGAGSAGCYREPGQEWTFYEIDPSVVEIARDTRLFTFLRDCAPNAKIVVGDARLSLRSAALGGYDLMVLDAYSSDAIPIHLLTREAVRLYLDKLSPNGLLAFNISNRHLDLPTVLANLAHDSALHYRVRDDLRIDPRLAGLGMMPSQWAVLARNREDLGAIAGDPRWVQRAPRPGTSVWTDDFSNVLSVFVWD